MAKYNVLVQATEDGWLGSIEGDVTVWGATMGELFDHIKETLDMEEEDDLRFHYLGSAHDSPAASN